MTKLVWDDAGNRRFETGVDQGVLYPLDTDTGEYTPGVAWNGLTTVTESPAGAAANPAYADNMKYMNLLSAETFGATIQSFTYPDEFGACDGTASPEPGVSVGQQSRAVFGLCYRTEIGDDTNSDAGFKLHMAYGLLSSPSQKAYATVNDSPAAVAFSWDVTSTPVPCSGYKPVSLLTIDSTKVDSSALSDLMDALYGTGGTDPRLPLPDEVLAFFAGTVTMITLTAPTSDGAHTVTIPTETGVTYYVDDVEHAGGSLILTTGQHKIVTARANDGYAFNTPVVTAWLFSYIS